MTLARPTPRAPLTPLLYLGFAALLTCLPLSARAIDGLQLNAMPRWQARVQLSSLDIHSPGMDTQRNAGSRILSANLLGDYYLTGSGLGGVQGGLRATGGMLMGPLSLSQSSAGLALGTNPFQFGQRSLSLLASTQDGSEANSSMSYMGIGYTGHALRSGFSFSADVGLVSSSYLGGLRLGRSNASGMEEVLRDLRYKPVLQLGLSYSY
mgnify:CR=1 FL=1